MTSKISLAVFTALFIVSTVTPVQSQLLNRLKKRTMDKIEKRVEDKIVEEVSEEIARRVMRPIDKAFDDMIKQSYRNEYGEDYSDEQLDSIMKSAGSGYAAFLEGLNQAADLPESYTFHYQMIVESKEENGDKNEMEMWFSKDKALAGFKTKDKEKDMVVMDMDNDIVVLYSEDKGKKTAQAIPAMLKISGAFIASSPETQKWMEVTVEGPGKSKKIAGYQAHQYKAENDAFKNEYYITKDIPFSWHDSFYQSLSQYAPGIYNESSKKMKGLMLEGKMYDKEEKESSSFKTKKIKEKTVVLNHSEYEIRGIVDGQ